VDPERIAAGAGIHYVVGNLEKSRLVDLVLKKAQEPVPARAEILGETQGYAEMTSRHPMDREWPAEWESEASLSSSNTRGFLKIQEGCNAFCTYCIIPYGRGPSRSLEPERVLKGVREACLRGVREIVLTGTNLGDYGTDLGTTFEELVRRILGETTLARLRLSSLDPSEITPGILALMEREPRLCPHFHVSLQSPIDRVLKRMKRKYTQAQARACLEAIAAIPRAPFVGMDLIAGFPGETAADFEGTLAFLERTPWSRLHVFPYSERAGTPATRLDGEIPESERARRARALMKLSLNRLGDYYRSKKEALVGGVLSDVLLEKGGDWVGGFSPDYVRVRIPHQAGLRNQLVSVRLGGLSISSTSGDAWFSGDLAVSRGRLISS
jgi:threonylcarbamoyladenosine tRNA methylthiotransferase MtaB